MTSKTGAALIAALAGGFAREGQPGTTPWSHGGRLPGPPGLRACCPTREGSAHNSRCADFQAIAARKAAKVAS